jgi:hypothetical protein
MSGGIGRAVIAGARGDRGGERRDDADDGHGQCGGEAKAAHDPVLHAARVPSAVRGHRAAVRAR